MQYEQVSEGIQGARAQCMHPSVVVCLVQSYTGSGATLHVPLTPGASHLSFNVQDSQDEDEGQGSQQISQPHPDDQQPPAESGEPAEAQQPQQEEEAQEPAADGSHNLHSTFNVQKLDVYGENTYRQCHACI